MVLPSFFLSSSFYYSVTLLFSRKFSSLAVSLGFGESRSVVSQSRPASLYLFQVDVVDMVVVISVVVSDIIDSASDTVASSCVGSCSCALTGSSLCIGVSCVLGHSVL